MKGMLPTPHCILSPYVQKRGVVNVWESYKNGKPLQLGHRVNSVAVSSLPPYKYGLPDGYNVNLYKCDSDKRYRKISGFSARVACCSFRKDGKLVIVGEEGGTLRICTTDKNKFHLRKIKAHKGSIPAASFFYDGLRAASLGSDANIRIWDVTLGSPLGYYSVCTGNEIARAMVTGMLDNNLICFGDLKGNVVICDVRQPRPIHKITLPAAVSALGLNKTDKLLAVAAGSVVQLWDLSAQKFHDYNGSQGLHLHYKVITGLFIEQHPVTDEEVLLSVAMDKLVKFTNLLNGTELHQLRCSSPLTAIGVTPKCESLVIGGERGFVKIKHYDPKLNSINLASSEEQNKVASSDTEEPYMSLLSQLSKPNKRDRFMSMKMDEWLEVPLTSSRRAPKEWFSPGDFKTDPRPHVPLIHQKTEISRSGRLFYAQTLEKTYNRVDILLRRFSHSRALTLALTCRSWMARSKRKIIPTPQYCLNLALAVIRELVRRDTLAAAIAGRDNRQLEYIFRFIYNNIWRKDAAAVCLELYHCILNTYTAEELMDIRGFVKVNRLLELTSSNLYSLSRIVDKIVYQPHNLLQSKSEPVVEDIHNCPLSSSEYSTKCEETSPTKKRRKVNVT
ncbi:hypothetical protein MN116_003770 [Schistosoma mekongi]|uniref:U3 small nucleolar RNA-associated protein 15 homolog n=1 Tax=Schistosoma mekongi TaxID=38744 RepID=A0AAE2D5W9_SCHME|nr:hypothetical protein MN116_003770 [Schistosoma mekongi]